MQDSSLSHQDHPSLALPQNGSQHLGQEYAPMSAAHSANPYIIYARMRQEEPAFFSPLVQAWVVSRYEDVITVLRDHRRFSMAILGSGAHRFTPEALAIMGSSPIAGVPSIVATDPPVHTRLRSCVTRALSAQRIASLEPRLRHLANRLIDQFEQDGQADFMRQFARPYPIMVIGSLLDVPEADMPHLLRWADDAMTLLFADVPAEHQIPLAQSYLALDQYVYDMVEERRKGPRDDLASDLLRAVDAGEAPLSTVEAADLLQRLLVAGFETTVKFLGNCLYQLLTERRYWQALLDDPGIIPALVEEALRFNSPVLSTFRQTTEAVELASKSIPKGAMVQVVLTSANHDEAIFPDAEIFDLQREKSSRHVTFGYGIHFCIGAPLARLETRVALEQLSQRLPSLRLVPDQEMVYIPNIVLHGLKQLLVEWDAGNVIIR